MSKATPILLMTRPSAASQGFVDKLTGTFSLIMSPLIGISFVGALPDMAGYHGLIFTSVHGVDAYVRAGGPRLPAYTVGQTTARAAQDAGFAAQSADGNADDLVAMLGRVQGAGPLLHVRGVHGAGNVAQRLTAAGLTAHEVVMYDQPEIPLTEPACLALTGETPVIAPVFSPRTAELLAQNPIKAPLLVAAMSEAVAKPLLGLHKTELMIAKRPESPAMVTLVTELLERACANDY